VAAVPIASQTTIKKKVGKISRGLNFALAKNFFFKFV
jgi:hypothetical protein